MKYDKSTITAIAVCMLLLITWPYIIKSIYPDLDKAKPVESTEQTVTSDSPSPDTDAQKLTESPRKPEKNIVTPIPTAKKAPAKTASATIPILPPVSLENDLEVVSFNLNEGCLNSILLKKHLLSDKSANVVLETGFSPGALSVTGEPSWTLLKVLDWSSDAEKRTLKLKRLFDNGTGQFEMTQNWRLDDNYQISYSFEIVNKSDTELTLKEILVNAGNMPPLQPLCGDQVRRDSHGLDYCLSATNQLKMVEADEENFPTSQTSSVKWLGTTNRYFASLLFPKTPFKDGNAMSREKVMDPKIKDKFHYIVSNSGLIEDVTLAPAQAQKWEYTFYAGSKEITLLQMIDPQATGVMRLGWSFIDWISQALLKALIILRGFCGSYGMSIIVLTILVRAAFWPVTQKANSSMRKMQKIQPKIQEIREKFKNNPQEMNKRVMLLYKEHKVNPLGGCLPIVLQIPVFFALYATLDGCIELRHSSFLWAHDLAQPDTVYNFQQLLGVDLPLNPLVLLMCVTMLLQQKLTPMGGDPMQQKMMMMMPVVMLFFLYNLPSGLTLYWTVSQVISIIQLLINRYFAKRDEERERNKAPA